MKIALQGGQLPSIEGNGNVNNLSVKLEQLPESVSQTKAQLEFKGQQVEIQEFSTLFGSIPAKATGILDLEQGFDIIAQVEPFQIEKVLESLKLRNKLPLELAGELKGSLKITGAATQPRVSAEFVSTKEIVADKLKVKDLVASLSFIDSSLLIKKIEANPIIGGKLTGTGQIKLEENQQNLVLEIKASNLPGSGIAEAYFGIKPSKEIGPVSAGVTMVGNLQEPENLTATGSASLKLASGNVIVKKLKLEKGRWEIAIDSKGVELGKLLPQLPQQLAGPIESSLIVKGNLNNLNLGAINAIGTAELVTSDGGKVQVTDLQIVDGDWLAAIALTNLQLGKLSPSFPAQLKEPIDGTMKLNGSLASLTALDKITATGTGELALGDGKVVANANLTAGQWQAKINADGITLKGELFPGIPSQLTNSVGKGEFSAKGNLENLTLKGIEATGTGELTLGNGKVLANVNLVQGKWQTDIEADGIRLEETLFPGIPEQLLNSLTNGTLAAKGNVDNLTLGAIEATGTGKLTRGNGTVVANVNLMEGQWQADIQADRITLKETLLPGIPEQFQNSLTTGTLSAKGNVDNLTLAAIEASGTGKLTLNNKGKVEAKLNLVNGEWEAEVQGTKITLRENLLPGIPEQLLNSLTNGTIYAKGNLDDLSLGAVEAKATGELTRGNGKVVANVNLVEGKWQADIQADDITLRETLLPGIPEQFQNSLTTGTLSAKGNVDNLTLAAIEASGTGKLTLKNKGKVEAKLNLVDGEWEAEVQGRKITLQENLFPGIPEQLLNSLTNGTIYAKGNLDNLSLGAVEAKATGELILDNGLLLANLNLAQGQLQAEITADDIEVERFAPQLATKFQGKKVKGNLQLQSTIGGLAWSPRQMQMKGQGSLTVAGTTAEAKGELIEGKWQVAIKANGINLDNFAPQLGAQTNPANGSLLVEGTLDDFSLQSLNVSEGTARVNLGSGTFTASNFSLTNGQWQGQLSFAGVELGELFQNDLGLPATVNGTLGISGNGPNFSNDAIALSGEASIALAGGIVKAKKVKLDRGKFAAEVTAEGVELQSVAEIVAATGVKLQPVGTEKEAEPQAEPKAFFDYSQGRLTGAMNFSGNLANLNPQAIQLSAQFQIEKSNLQEAVAGNFNWNGERLEILEAKAGEKLQAKGFADLEWTNSGTIKEIKQFDFDLKAKKVPLESLPIPFPQSIKQHILDNSTPVLAGNAGFDGKIAGTLAAPQVNGEIELENLTFAGLAFDEMLSGEIELNPGEEGKLELTGVAKKKILYQINFV